MCFPLQEYHQQPPVIETPLHWATCTSFCEKSYKPLGIITTPLTLKHQTKLREPMEKMDSNRTSISYMGLYELRRMFFFPPRLKGDLFT